jgi:AcrR family transcriptional regulator
VDELKSGFHFAEFDGWRQKRSQETRLAILEATIDSLASHGYAQTTLQTIAASAGLSRSAMIHHYASKHELIAAATDFAFYKRITAFRARMSVMNAEERVEKHRGVDIAWELQTLPAHRAYVELAIASRTDADLAGIFLAKAHIYDRMWREETAQMFPEWQGYDLQLGSDLTDSVLEGLRLNHPTWGEERRIAVLSALKKILTRIERDEL